MTVGIVGLGLIGGSIGLALRDPSRTILGFDPSPDAVRLAQTRFCIDRPATLEEVAQADIVFVAAPPDATIRVIESLLPHLGPDTVVTDCASVKGDIVAWAESQKLRRFIPGHPMAGHEKTTAAYASAWMFRNARWILTPFAHTQKSAVRALEKVLKEMGATAVITDAGLHDRQVAIVSHLPHVFAAILVQLGDELDRTDVGAGSWKDLTRVGGVDPELWTQILMGNRAEIARALTDVESQVAAFRQALETHDDHALRDILQRARQAKKRQET